MKIRYILAAGLLAMGASYEASAAETIYLTGSTAFRGNMWTALSDTGFWDGGTVQIATRKGSTLSGSSYMLFHGTKSGVEYYVSCAWSGSEAGIASVAGVTIPDGFGGTLPGAPETFLKTDGSVPYTTVTGDPAAGELEATTRQGDIAMADSSIAVSLNKNSGLTEFGRIGVVTFTWVKNVNTTPNSSWTNLKNITSDQAKTLLSFPQVAAFLTGSAADTSYVYPVGRNKGSGTRVDALASIGYPVTQDVVQFSIGGNPFTGGLTLGGGDNNGYESGGDVAKALSVDGSCQQTDPNFGGTGWLAVGYLGVGDAQKEQLTIANNWLTLDGVMSSDGAIEEGNFKYWNYEHMYGRVSNGGLNSNQSSFAGALKTAAQGTLGGGNPAAHSSGIAISFMHAEKITDLSTPTRL